MRNSINLNDIKKDLEFCKNYWTVIYGSFLSDHFIKSRSDIDIAVISQKQKKQKNLKFWYDLIGKSPKLYDIRIFELFSLYMKIQVITNYKVLFGDPLEISEYFYQYYKIWKDMEHRVEENQFKSFREKRRLMENRKLLEKKP